MKKVIILFVSVSLVTFGLDFAPSNVLAITVTSSNVNTESSNTIASKDVTVFLNTTSSNQITRLPIIVPLSGSLFANSVNVWYVLTTSTKIPVKGVITVSIDHHQSHNFLLDGSTGSAADVENGRPVNQTGGKHYVYANITYTALIPGSIPGTSALSQVFKY